MLGFSADTNPDCLHLRVAVALGWSQMDEPAGSGPGAAEAELLFPLLLVFLPPPDLVAQLMDPGPAELPAGSLRGSGAVPGLPLLRGLRASVAAVHPDVSLMVGCVDLDRHLTQRERAPGSVRAPLPDSLASVHLHGLNWPGAAWCRRSTGAAWRMRSRTWPSASQRLGASQPCLSVALHAAAAVECAARPASLGACLSYGCDME